MALGVYLTTCQVVIVAQPPDPTCCWTEAMPEATAVGVKVSITGPLQQWTKPITPTPRGPHPVGDGRGAIDVGEAGPLAHS